MNFDEAPDRKEKMRGESPNEKRRSRKRDCSAVKPCPDAPAYCISPPEFGPGINRRANQRYHTKTSLPAKVVHILFTQRRPGKSLAARQKTNLRLDGPPIRGGDVAIGKEDA